MGSSQTPQVRALYRKKKSLTLSGRAYFFNAICRPSVQPSMEIRLIELDLSAVQVVG